MNKVSKQAHFTLGKLGSERRHAVATLRDLVVDVGLGLFLKFADSKGRNNGPIVKGSSISFSSVTDSAVLPE